MACADNFADEDVYDTSTQASDEIREMFCEDCEKDLGNYVKADGFCVNCAEYLCATCIRYHKKHLLQHTLLDSSNMPQDFCFDKCTNHPQEITKFYCKKCEATACSKCKTEKHNKCSEICHIPSIVQSDQMCGEIRQLSVMIDETLEELTIKKDRAVSNLTEVYSNKKDASIALNNHLTTLKRQVEDQHKHLLDVLDKNQTTEIEAHAQKRAEVIAMLDKEEQNLLERLDTEKRQMGRQLQSHQNDVFENIDKKASDLEKQSDHMKQTDVKKLQFILSRTEKAKTEVNEMKASIDRIKNKGEKCQLFVAMKNFKYDLEKLKTNMKINTYATKIQNYEFQSNDDKINLNNTECQVQFGHILDKSEAKRKIMYSSSLNLGDRENERNTIITGLCKVSDQLVVANDKEAVIKQIDLKRGVQTSSIQLESKPFDVTCVDADQIATTLPSSKKIQFLCGTQTCKLSLAHAISLGWECYGIEFNKPNILVACRDPGCINIVSITGNPIKTLTGFHEPRYINFDQNSDMIYVEDTAIRGSGQAAKTVKQASSDGKIIRISKFFNKGQSGLAIDKSGSVYIGSCDNNPLFKMLLGNNTMSIIKLSASLEKVQEIDTRENFSGEISSLFYCNKDNSLYAGTTKGCVLVFKVK